MTLLILLFLVLATAGSLAWFFLTHRRVGQHSQPFLRLLRQIDKLILAGESLPSLTEQIVNLISQELPIQGALIRTVDQKTGDLTIVAVSDSLAGQEGEPSLTSLRGRAVPAEKMLRSGSLIMHAVNERRMISSEHLRDFGPPLMSIGAADRAQELLGMKAIVAYPIVADDKLYGAITFYFAKPLSKVSEEDHNMMQALANEAGLAMVNTALLGQLEDMNEQLQHANDHLQTLDATKDEFISVTSHQLRSPLTAMKGYLSMLEEGDFGPIPAKQETVIEQISRSTDEMINVLNDLLSVSRINAGRFEINRVASNLEDLVRDIVNEMKPLAQEKSLPLSVSMPRQAIGVVFLDPLRIRQVVTNFIDNAIKYTPRGRIKVDLSADDKEVTFTVTDNGIGIPKDEMAQMFTKFYRAKNARQMVTIGTGLGLFVARRVIEDHHGSLILESQEGKGSTFGFRLPIAELTQPMDAPLIDAAAARQEVEG